MYNSTVSIFSLGPAWPLQHQIQGLGSARCALVLASSQCSRYVVIPQIVEMVLVKEGEACKLVTRNLPLLARLYASPPQRAVLLRAYAGQSYPYKRQHQPLVQITVLRLPASVRWCRHLRLHYLPGSRHSLQEGARAGPLGATPGAPACGLGLVRPQPSTANMAASPCRELLAHCLINFCFRMTASRCCSCTHLAMPQTRNHAGRRPSS